MKKCSVTNFFIFLASLFLIGCGGSDDSGSTPEIVFNVKDAESIAFTTTHDAFSINSNEEFTSTVNRKVTDFKLLGDYYYFEVLTEEDYANGIFRKEYYRVDRYGNHMPMPFVEMPMTSNDNGDLIFRNFDVYRAHNEAMEKLIVNIDNAFIQTVSGNFLVIRGGNTYQVFDSVTNYRVNVQGVNGPRLLAVSEHTALIDDGRRDELLLDSQSNTRSPAGVNNLWGEAIYLGDYKGSYLVNYAEGTGESYIFHISADGSAEQFFTDPLIVDGECMNCANLENDYLFGSEEFVVVKEATSVVIYDVERAFSYRILEGLNILSIDIFSDTLVYVAEDSYGKKIYGKHQLSNGYEFEAEQLYNLESIRSVK